MDQTLTEMAKELREALIARGLDTKNPPTGGPPAGRAFTEYKKRGGNNYDDADVFAKALVNRVVKWED